MAMAISRSMISSLNGYRRLVGLFAIPIVMMSSASKLRPAFADVIGSEPGKAANSWAGRAQTKLQRGLGWQHEQTEKAAKGMKDATSEISMKTKDKASAYISAGDEAEEAIKRKAGDAFASAERAYGEAKQKAEEAYKSTKDSVTAHSTPAFEATKEKASKVAGDLGDAMKPKEL